MATETQRPNGELSDSGLVASDYTDHNADPDSVSTTTAATSNNTSTEYGVDFPTPSGALTVGADLQEFRVGVEQFDAGQSGTPTARIELWENGVLVRAGSDVPVSTYAVLSFTWNANELSNADGSLVQCKVIGTKSGGSPGARNTVNIGNIEWNVVYSTSIALVVQDGAHSHTGDNVSLVQHNVLSIQDGQHTHTGEQVTLLAGASLIIQDASHAHSSDTPSLTQHNILVIQAGDHSHIAGVLALIQHNILSIDDSAHANTSDNVTLSAGTALVISDALSAHAADAIGLTQHNILAIQDGNHAHAPDILDLIQHNILVIQAASHAHASDVLDISRPVLVISSGLHAHTAEEISLIFAIVFVAPMSVTGIYNTSHARGAENISDVFAVAENEVSKEATGEFHGT